MRFRITSGYVHWGAALASVAGFHVAWREVTHKIADQVLVRADWPGFLDCARAHPWGAVDWCARMLSAADLVWWGVLAQLTAVAAVAAMAQWALRRRRSSFAPFAPWLVAALYALPTLSLGVHVWLLPHPPFAQLQLVWFAVFAGFLAWGWRGLVGFAALQGALVLLGNAAWGDLPAGETLESAWALPLQLAWDARSAAALLPFALLAAAAFAKRPAVLPPWAHVVPPALFAVLFVLVLPRRDCRDQLEMERAVRENRFDDALAVAPGKAHPERMETAWRILALFRADRLDRDLFRYPMPAEYADNPEDEMVMAGPLMLFQYGFVLPARRWIYEAAAVKGWQPQYFRLLGDAALVTGEVELARKYFAECARFPFRGDFAKRRLAALETVPLTTAAFPDLEEPFGMHGVWQGLVGAPGASPYFGNECVVDRFVYAHFRQLSNCPPAMLKMLFAVALLDGKPDVLKNNPNAMRALYPDGRIGPVFLEALK